MTVPPSIAESATPITPPDNAFGESVLEVEHYTDSLFRFRLTRPPSFRFRSGEFVMLGLPGDRPIWRAYSIASPLWDDSLEFYSIKVAGGPLTQHLQKIKPGDGVWFRKKATGTLVLDALLPGKRLWLISTGTGFAPFAALIRDTETYEKFDQVIVTHTCRHLKDLAYSRQVVAASRADPLVGGLATKQLLYIASTTRAETDQAATSDNTSGVSDAPMADPLLLRGRITALLSSGELYKAADLTPLNHDTDRVMICGSIAMLQDVRNLVEASGFSEGANNAPGQFVVERAFVG